MIKNERKQKTKFKKTFVFKQKTIQSLIWTAQPSTRMASPVLLNVLLLNNIILNQLNF